jgi:hypothetical protein
VPGALGTLEACLNAADPEVQMFGVLALAAYKSRRAADHLTAELAAPEAWLLGVFDYGRDGADWFVVTELPEGETLRTQLEHAPVDSAPAGRVPLARALEWAVAVAHVESFER